GARGIRRLRVAVNADVHAQRRAENDLDLLHTESQLQFCRNSRNWYENPRGLAGRNGRPGGSPPGAACGMAAIIVARGYKAPAEARTCFRSSCHSDAATGLETTTFKVITKP